MKFTHHKSSIISRKLTTFGDNTFNISKAIWNAVMWAGGPVTLVGRAFVALKLALKKKIRTLLSFSTKVSCFFHEKCIVIWNYHYPLIVKPFREVFFSPVEIPTWNAINENRLKVKFSIPICVANFVIFLKLQRTFLIILLV